ncbi:RNA polymerase sigma-70 factor [Olivibacter sp. SDN3]|uniref:RNA polymerase sigma factor n=1 Tax=Olivibacter sp. SDN3 TaxID=2764720 RepID=UPI00165195B2|nr:RNA polymerase sigma-70 factor [Olivibacter sp. SDN3]QNL47868.1 RNA polymerase sigma-70 factor [Olivibacter sp. SDN3]
MSADYNQYKDNELLMQLVAGKQQALEALYNRYWDRLFVVAANLLGSPEEAEECVQNVFIGLWKRRENLQLTHSLHTYLAVAVKYQALSVLSRNQRRKERPSQIGFDDDPIDAVSPEADFIAKELRTRIEQSINRLPPQCQLVFRMSREQDKSVKEIAESLGLSENTVKMHLKNANKKLRSDLLFYIFFLSHTPFL